MNHESSSRVNYFRMTVWVWHEATISNQSRVWQSEGSRLKETYALGILPWSWPDL